MLSIKTNILHVALLPILLFIIAPAQTALAWPDKIHEQIALELIDILPAETAVLVKGNKEAYMKGVAEEPELYEDLTEEKKAPTANYIRQKGMERYIFYLKRLSFFFDKKSEAHAIAYEIGKTARLTADLLEPLPADENFSALQIAGHRMFFMDDIDQSEKNYKFMYAGRRNIASFPVRIDKELEISMKKGEIIYNGYRKGIPFEKMEPDARTMINRAINLLADTLYTLQLNQGQSGGGPFDPSMHLLLDRFRKKADTGASKVDTPSGPTAPTAPDKPEKIEAYEKNVKEN